MNFRELIIANEVASTIDDLYAGERFMPIIDNINVKFAKFCVKHKIGIHSGIEKDIERFKNDPDGCIKYCQSCIKELEGLKRNWFTSKDVDGQIDALINEYQKKLDELNLSKLSKKIRESVKVPPIVLSSGAYDDFVVNIDYDMIKEIASGEIDLNRYIKNLQHFVTNVSKWLKQNETTITAKAIKLHPDFSNIPDTTNLHIFPVENLYVFSYDKEMACIVRVALSESYKYYDEDLFEITFTESGKWTFERI